MTLYTLYKFKPKLAKLTLIFLKGPMVMSKKSYEKTYKMSELVMLSDVPKSTILYYIKEGLLPEPIKIKPNLHLYSQTFLDMLEFIKYSQSKLNLSVKELKVLVSMPNFNFENYYECLLTALDKFMSSEFKEPISKDNIANGLGMSVDKIDNFIKDGLVIKRDGVLTQKDEQILEILDRCDKFGIDIAKVYLKFAKEISRAEIEIAKPLLKNTNDKNELLKLILDITLTLKPYLFDYYTFEGYKKEL